MLKRKREKGGHEKQEVREGGCGCVRVCRVCVCVFRYAAHGPILRKVSAEF